MLQCVIKCSSVLQHVTLCCSAMQRVAACGIEDTDHYKALRDRLAHSLVAQSSIVVCAAVCCSVWQCVP